jgi:hypothetical protein
MCSELYSGAEAKLQKPSAKRGFTNAWRLGKQRTPTTTTRRHATPATNRGDQEQSRRSDKTGLRGRVTLWTRRHVSGLEASVAGTRGREKPRRRDAGRISATTCRYAWAVPIPGCDTVLGHPAPATLLFVPKPCAGFSCKPIHSWLAQQTVNGCMHADLLWLMSALLPRVDQSLSVPPFIFNIFYAETI